MKAIMAMFLLAAATPLARGAEEGGSPIGKVLEMIGDLQAKTIKEGEKAQKLYEEFAEWCEDRSKDLGFEIKTGKAEVADLKATIEEETATSAALETKIDELSSSISSNEAELKEATELRAKEAKDFAAEEKELMEVLDMLERASGILEREMAKGGASMLQTKNVGSLAQAFEVMVKASLIGSADAQKLTALVQTKSSDSESEEDADADALTGAPAAAAYEGKSSGIIDTMADLTDKAQTQLDEVRNKETQALHNYQMLKQSLSDEIRYASKDMDEAKKGLASSTEKKSVAEGDLAVITKDLAAGTEGKAELHHDCMSKAQDFEVETNSRAEELKALAEAKKILVEMTTGAAEATSFVQVKSKLKSRSDLANFEVVRFVRDLARKNNAPALTQLATRMAAAMHAHAGADPFAKVKSLITDMVTKLEDEAEADATKKAYCDKEMGETEEKKSDKEDEVEKLTTGIEQMTSKSAKLKEEVATAQKELAKLATSQAEMDKLRKEENDAYKENKAEMEMGVEGVKKALAVLKEYYAKEDKGHDAGDGAGAGIIGLLEVCESDFSKELAEIISTEEAAVATYEAETKENEVETATKSADVKHMTKESASLDKAVGESSGDVSGVKTELSAVLEYYSKIKAECIAKPEPYAERKKRREAEIAGLKEALTILENESAFVQTSSRHLRGVKAHAQVA